MKTVATFILMLIIADHTSPPPFAADETGVFGTTKNPRAKEDFDKALLLLHNFEYPDARDLFREARKKDPQFAMAYWGEAMTYNHPIWHNQDADRARQVIGRYNMIAKTSEPALSPVDRDMMASLDILYGERSKEERDKEYADFMETLYEKHKDNHEVAAFYALSLLGLTQGWNTELCNQAAAVAGAVLEENPVHAGALHYFIHAEDHPEFAKQAWEQANDYAKVASYSGHALHMPSHIYLALGLWDDVVHSNEVSWQAGVDRKAAKKLDNDALNYHGHWWLEYGYLQQGRFDKALDVLQNQWAFTRELPSASARNHFVLMRGHYLVETNDWESTFAEEEVKTGGLRLEVRTVDRFIKGLIAFKKGDRRTLRAMIDQVEKDIETTAQTQRFNEGLTACGALSLPQIGINQATILKEELMALLYFLNNDPLAARAHFKKAVDLEDETGHFFGPPEIVKPAHEFYGEFLLAIGHAEQALVCFETSLRKSPGRTQSLVGLRDASRLTGNGEKERAADQKLKNNLRHAGTASSIKGFFSVP